MNKSITLFVEHMDDFIYKLHDDSLSFDIIYSSDEFCEGIIKLNDYTFSDINTLAVKYIIKVLTPND